jgi:hypothetical protein
MKKKAVAFVLLIGMLATVLTGCGTTAVADAQVDLAMFQSTYNQFALQTTINLLNDRNANLLAGNWAKDSDEFKEVQKTLPDLAKTGLDVAKRMNMKTSEGKKLKTALVAQLQHSIKLLDLNLKAVKSGKATDKQKAMDLNQKTAGVVKDQTDAVAALNAAINVKPKKK